MAIAAAAPRSRPGRARPPQSRARPRDALPDAVRGALRLRRLRGVPRRGTRARRYEELRSRVDVRARMAAWQESGSRASWSRRSRTWATSRSPRRPTSARGRCRSPATPRVRRSDRSARRDHGAARIDPAGAGPPDGLRPGRRRRARLRPRRCDRVVRNGYGKRAVERRLRQLLLPLFRRRRRRGAGGGAEAARQDRRRPRARGDDSLSLRRVAGLAHWHPEGLPPGEEPGLAAVAFWAPANLDPPDEDDRVASSAAHGLIVDICAVEVNAATGAVSVLEYVTVHDAGLLLNPALADGQVLGGFAHGAAAPSTSGTSTTSGAT